MTNNWAINCLLWRQCDTVTQILWHVIAAVVQWRVFLVTKTESSPGVCWLCLITNNYSSLMIVTTPSLRLLLSFAGACRLCLALLLLGGIYLFDNKDGLHWDTRAHTNIMKLDKYMINSPINLNLIANVINKKNLKRNILYHYVGFRPRLNIIIGNILDHLDHHLQY